MATAAEEPRSNGSQRNAERLGDFLVGKAFDVAEHHHLSKSGIEPLDRVLDRRAEIESRVHVIHARDSSRVVGASGGQ